MTNVFKKMSEELQMLRDAEPELVCPYCGDHMSESYDDCCGESGHGEIQYVTSDGELLTEDELSRKISKLETELQSMV